MNGFKTLPSMTNLLAKKNAKEKEDFVNSSTHKKYWANSIKSNTSQQGIHGAVSKIKKFYTLENRYNKHLKRK